jgi:thiol-disulfide isomerase/thioredoxin
MRLRQPAPPAQRALLATALAVALAVALLAAAGCARDGEDAAAQAGAAAAELPRVEDFKIIVYQGGAELGAAAADAGEIALSSVLAQGKPVVLNFWAGLCPPCRAEMPEFQEVYDEFEGRIILLGIDLGPFTGLGTSAEGKALLAELEVDYPSGTTDDATVLARFGVLGMPSTLFVTPDGGLSNKWTGLLTRAKLTEFVDELLAVSAAAGRGAR